MEAVKQSGAREMPPSSPKIAARFIPVLPTLWPHMLVSRPRAAPAFPFEAPGVRLYYFGRNAVWTLSRVLQLDRGEVLVPAYHHGVEVEALLDAGATVRFYRVSARMGVDPDDVARLIGPRTRAVYLIHYLGFPGPSRALRELCDSRGIALIEDCALALLSREGERPLGTWGDAAIWSVYKTLPVPNGGALLMSGTRPQGLPEPVPPPLMSTLSHLASSLLLNLELRGGPVGRALRQTFRGLGRSPVHSAGIARIATGTQIFDRAHAELGASAIARRIILAQDFPAIVEKRRRNYFFLLSHLRELAAPIFGQLPPGVCPLFYPLRVEDKSAVTARLAARGIEVVDFWRYGHPSCPTGEFPDVEALRRGIVEIPIHQDLTPAAMTFLADEVRKALRNEP